ncbi:MAG TPA: hypothetical protein PK177_22495, partial [Burkholderiaceae bacterium]|nr:hypothetical protein [Burkholderiaceae bacterium]
VEASAAPAPAVRWDGQARGSAQAAGPAQVAGRDDCQRVNELAVIRGQEVRQVSTFCKDPSSGRYVRV